MTRIAVVEGDGIGREVIPVAASVLRSLRPDWEQVPVELGLERWRRTGTALDGADLGILSSCEAVLFGAVSSAPHGEYPSVVLRLRRALDLYANIRPVKGEACDLVVVRENSEGLYSGRERIEADRACTERVITRIGTERIARVACGIGAGRRKLDHRPQGERARGGPVLPRGRPRGRVERGRTGRRLRSSTPSASTSSGGPDGTT